MFTGGLLFRAPTTWIVEFGTLSAEGKRQPYWLQKLRQQAQEYSVIYTDEKSQCKGLEMELPGVHGILQAPISLEWGLV